MYILKLSCHQQKELKELVFVGAASAKWQVKFGTKLSLIRTIVAPPYIKR
tara:strand:+ start:550 stop:699 length:150 start_codon:yes stop_codon:yes gene_type:complete